MAIANFYFENKQFIHSESVYEEILNLNYDTIELKKMRIKIYYNHAQQLSFEQNYEKGLQIVAVRDSGKLSHLMMPRLSVIFIINVAITMR